MTNSTTTKGFRQKLLDFFCQSPSGEILFWAFATFAVLIFLWTNGLHDSEERWAEICREMLLSGDYWHPTINGVPYTDKPLLSYWLILLFSKLFGWGINEFACRFPSALSALLALFATKRLTTHFFGDTAGRLAGWILLSSSGFLIWARTGEADMENCAAISLAVYWFIKFNDKARFFHYLIFYVLVFVGACTKGLVTPAVVFCLLLPYVVMSKRLRQHLCFANFAALFIGIIIYFLPFVIAGFRGVSAWSFDDSGLGLVWRENFVRYIQPFDHKDPIYSYFYNLPRILFPWSPLMLVILVVAVYLYFHRSVRDNLKRDEVLHGSFMLLIGVKLVFIFFTVSGSRRWYYIMPLAPFCAFLLSIALLRLKERRVIDIALNVVYVLCVGVAALAVVSPLSWFIFNRYWNCEFPWLATICATIGGIVSLLVLLIDQPLTPVKEFGPDENKKKFFRVGERDEENICSIIFGLPGKIASITVSMAIMTVVMVSCVIPALDIYRPIKPFFQRVAADYPDLNEYRILLYGGSTRSACEAIFYLNLQPINSDDVDKSANMDGKFIQVLPKDPKQAAKVINNLRERRRDVKILLLTRKVRPRENLEKLLVSIKHAKNGKVLEPDDKELIFTFDDDDHSIKNQSRDFWRVYDLTRPR